MRLSALAITLLALTGCNQERDIDEGSFLTLDIGDPKEVVLAKLVALDEISRVRPVLEEQDEEGEGWLFLELAPVEVEDEPPGPAERQYLFHYDTWYFADDGERARVIMLFKEDLLSRIRYRSW